MLYRKGDYKYQLAAIEEFLFTHIFPEKDLITEFIELDIRGHLTIREGYAWDGPSGPTKSIADTLKKIPFIGEGLYNKFIKTFLRGSLAHDALYQLMRMELLDRSNKYLADRLLQKICIEDKMWYIRAWWVYRGVKLGGNTSTNPKNAKKVLEAP